MLQLVQHNILKIQQRHLVIMDIVMQVVKMLKVDKTYIKKDKHVLLHVVQDYMKIIQQ